MFLLLYFKKYINKLMTKIQKVTLLVCNFLNIYLDLSKLFIYIYNVFFNKNGQNYFKQNFLI